MSSYLNLWKKKQGKMVPGSTNIGTGFIWTAWLIFVGKLRSGLEYLGGEALNFTFFDWRGILCTDSRGSLSLRIFDEQLHVAAGQLWLRFGERGGWTNSFPESPERLQTASVFEKRRSYAGRRSGNCGSLQTRPRPLQVGELNRQDSVNV